MCRTLQMDAITMKYILPMPAAPGQKTKKTVIRIPLHPVHMEK